ncbi:type 1 glutamine amidotransferase [Paenibacillus sp. HW567]|uniref:type 1 glutamine amidotransferase n=1 Tax=Paenibacillus sp. HW567 TaxID=1034769 RepID=UPI00036FEB0F|nr:type 1 glutamine amidotransferase [Paenibacillus sp. HW567]
MRIHYLQHVHFEGPGQMDEWARKNSHEQTITMLYDQPHLPSLSEFDLLVVLGGPMGVYEESDYPWLQGEKQFIKEVIQARKLVLGICLGAQLIAEVIGGEVYKNNLKEIGWFPVKLTERAGESAFLHHFPQEFTPFHWHGDTFRLPAKAQKMALSLGCANQAYVYDEHVIGLQFHLESSRESIQQLIRHGEDDLQEGLYVQNPAEMLAQGETLLSPSNELLFGLLEAIEEKHRSLE